MGVNATSPAPALGTQQQGLGAAPKFDASKPAPGKVAAAPPKGADLPPGTYLDDGSFNGSTTDDDFQIGGPPNFHQQCKKPLLE